MIGNVEYLGSRNLCPAVCRIAGFVARPHQQLWEMVESVSCRCLHRVINSFTARDWVSTRVCCGCDRCFNQISASNASQYAPLLVSKSFSARIAAC